MQSKSPKLTPGRKKNPKIGSKESLARFAWTHWCIYFCPSLRHLAGAFAFLLLADSWCAVVPTCNLFGVPPQSYDDKSVYAEYCAFFVTVS